MNLEVNISHKPFFPSKGEIVDVLVKLKTPVRPKTGFRNPVSLCCVLDCSGSMSGTPLDNAKLALQHLIENLSAKDEIHLVTYASDAKIEFQMESSEKKKELKEIVTKLGTYGCTNMMKGVFLGRDVLAKSKLKDKHMLLFSDGQVNAGIQNKDVIYKEIKKLRTEKGIIVNSFGLGLNYDEVLMKTISEYSNGIYYYIENSKTIHEKFSNAFGLLTSILFRNCNLQCLGENGAIVTELNAESKEEVLKNGFEVGALFEDDSRVFIVIVDVKSPKDDEEFLKVCVTGENTETNEKIKQEFVFKAKVSDDEEKLKQRVKEVDDRRTISDVIKDQVEITKKLQSGYLDVKIPTIPYNKYVKTYDEKYTKYFDMIEKKDDKWVIEDDFGFDDDFDDDFDDEFGDELDDQREQLGGSTLDEIVSEKLLTDEEREKRKKEYAKERGIKMGEIGEKVRKSQNEGELRKKEIMLTIEKSIEKLLPLKNDYIEAKVLYDQLILNLENVKVKNYEYVQKTGSYITSMTTQTTKSYVN